MYHVWMAGADNRTDLSTVDRTVAHGNLFTEFRTKILALHYKFLNAQFPFFFKVSRIKSSTKNKSSGGS